MTAPRKNNPVKLIVSIDIGTTYTAASYHVLGSKSKTTIKLSSFQEVNKWPKQAYPDAKIPSVLYYDFEGIARLCGAETLDESSLVEAEKNEWQKAEWWKLHLRPEYLPAPSENFLPSLPLKVLKVDDIFRDQFAYVIENLRDFFIKAYGYGEKFWNELYPTMDVVLTVPNGWEGQHQQRMRFAAMKAGLVGAGEGNRIRFVSEGEAAIHYCLDAVQVHSLNIGSVVIICDAGGGTTDISIYKVNSLSPISLEEVASPQCFLAGGVFVNYAAEEMIKARLGGSKWDTRESINSAMRIFELHVKRSFRGHEMKMHIKLDGIQENDMTRGIERGRLSISKAEMLKIFGPIVKLVTGSLEEVIKTCGLKVEQIFVVGGFAESDYVYSEIAKMTATYNIPVSKPDGALSKAVTHGALCWYIDSGVQVRVARFHYGAETEMCFNPSDIDMAGRIKFKDVLGRWRVRDAWTTIVKKNHRLRSGCEHFMPFHRVFTEGEDLEVEMELYAYRWDHPPKFFKDTNGSLQEGFIHLGTVRANLTECFNAAHFKDGPSGKRYKTLEYDICLLFDEIEIRSHLRWKVKNALILGDATIAYDL